MIATQTRRLLIIEPNRLMREGLRAIVGQALSFVSDAASANIFLDRADATPPDLVMWGVGIPLSRLKPGLFAFHSRFADLARPVRHVVLANSLSPSAIRQVAALDVEALLLDDVSTDVLQRSLDLVMLGQRLFPATRARNWNTAQAEVLAFPSLPRRLPAITSPASTREVVLSSREAEILRYLVEGYTNKAIARAVQITEAAVKVHVKALLRKVGVNNRTQVAIWALNNTAAFAAPERTLRRN